MISQYEIPALIAGQLPQISRDLRRHPGMQPTAYQSIQLLTDYTRRMALEHEFKTVGKCMGLMGRLYKEGNALVRNAVETIFIFSFSSMMMSCNIMEWRIIQTYMPACLYDVYVHQVMSSH
jgi:hypothetical protein